jgi:hypothetical protein
MLIAPCLAAMLVVKHTLLPGGDPVNASRTLLWPPEPARAHARRRPAVGRDLSLVVVTARMRVPMTWQAAGAPDHWPRG